MEVTETEKFFGGPTSSRLRGAGVSGIVGGIKKAMKEEIGEYITCSIGISYNRLLAKLASDINKPNGVFEITLQNRDEILFKAKLTDVCGLGFRLEKKLFDMGITNFKTLREVPIECLGASLGSFWPKELKRLSFGEDDSLLTRVGEISKMKSVSRTFTLYQNTTDLKIIRATLRNLCEEAGWKAREMGMAGWEVGITIQGEGLGELGRLGRLGNYKHKTLKYFIDGGGDLFEVIWRLFEEIWPIGQIGPIRSIRFLGVWLGMLKNKKRNKRVFWGQIF